MAQSISSHVNIFPFILGWLRRTSFRRELTWTRWKCTVHYETWYEAWTCSNWRWCCGQGNCSSVSIWIYILLLMDVWSIYCFYCHIYIELCCGHELIDVWSIYCFYCHINLDLLNSAYQTILFVFVFIFLGQPQQPSLATTSSQVKSICLAALDRQVKSVCLAALHRQVISVSQGKFSKNQENKNKNKKNGLVGRVQ